MDLKIFLTAFTTIFLAEMGDKTQLAVVTMSASSKSAISVFLGAGLALVVVTAIGTVFGSAITRFIPELVLKRIAAALFVGIGIWMWVKP